MGLKMQSVNLSMTSALKCQESLEKFCKTLRVHLNKWKETNEFGRPVEVLVNLSEQWRCIEKAEFGKANDDLEFLEATRDSSKSLILLKAEDEIALMKSIVDQLTKLNSDLKNKLILLENSTIDWDWDETYLGTGTAFQPPLEKVLRMALDYSDYFGDFLRKINMELKGLDFRDEVKMQQFQKCFDISFDAEDYNDIGRIITVTQYVDNTKNVI